jgi:hypothetical protein
MKKVNFIRLNMLLNLQLEAFEAKSYAQYLEECERLAAKYRAEAEAYGRVTPEKIDDTKIRTPYPVFYENKVILPYLDLTQKDKVIGIKVRHLTLYKNALRSQFREIKKKLDDMSEHFGFPIDCPSDADLLLFAQEQRNINAVATLMRQYGIDFTSVEGVYWYRNSPVDRVVKAYDIAAKEILTTMSRDNVTKAKLRPLIGAEYTTPQK